MRPSSSPSSVVIDLGRVRENRLNLGVPVCGLIGGLGLLYAVAGLGASTVARIVLAPLSLLFLGLAFVLRRYAVPQAQAVSQLLTIDSAGIGWQGDGTSWRVQWHELTGAGVTRQHYQELLSGGSSVDASDNWVPRTGVVIELTAATDLGVGRPGLAALGVAPPGGPAAYRIGLGRETGSFAATAANGLQHFAGGRFVGVRDEGLPRRTRPVIEITRYDGGHQPIG